MFRLPLILFPLFLLFVANPLQAQPFELVDFSTKKVSEIIEWQDQGKGKPAKKIGHSFFDRQGRLKEYRGGISEQARQTQLYDKKGRVIEVRANDDGLTLATFYAYPAGQKVMHTTYRKKHYKTYWYYKGNKLVEEKSFAKGEELGAKFLLKERRLYQYDKRDSLIAEVHYIHPVTGSGTPLKRKVIHKYHPKSGKKTATINYDTDGKVRTRVQYSYDTKGRFASLTETFNDGRPPRSLVYKYKNRKIWQKIDDYGYTKTVQIFNDGRLIRTRSYVGDSLFSLVDYQYKYY